MDVETLRKDIIGENASFSGPFGKRRVVYCDLIASGRSVGSIERFIREKVLPSYGSTHTTTSFNSRKTTSLRKQARNIIRQCVNASDSDVVIFVGCGATGAAHKILHALKPRIESSAQTIVFVGPMEHHSSFLPWRELQEVDVVMVPEDAYGRVDAQWLERRLRRIRQDPKQVATLVMGVFSAASNATGTLTDDVAVTALMRQHGALVFWDYATAAPYVSIDMNPREGAEKHAICFSMHKFLGGVQGPGVLVAKKSLFCNPVPHWNGGGTVAFVTRNGHRYLDDIEEREEGGTPAIVENIRAGLAFQLKKEITPDLIMDKEHLLWERARKRLKTCPNLILLGNASLPRLPILSFLVHNPLTGFFLHHNFVCAVLNDLFGIQSRGGCVCAGPYAQELLGIDDQLANQYENIYGQSWVSNVELDQALFEVLKPGFVRLSLPWYIKDSDIDFILDCLELASKRAWLLLPQYRLRLADGRWLHKSLKNNDEEEIHLSDFLNVSTENRNEDKESVLGHDQVLKRANEIFGESWEETVHSWLRGMKDFGEDERVTESSLRWFMMPSEAAKFLATGDVEPKSPPFWPKSYPASDVGFSCHPVGSYGGTYDDNCDVVSAGGGSLGERRMAERNADRTEKEGRGGEEEERVAERRLLAIKIRASLERCVKQNVGS